MYDIRRDYHELTEYQIAFLGLVALKRQKLDVLKTVAIVKSALCGYNPQLGKEIIEGAQRDLKNYIYEARNLAREDDIQQKRLAEAMSRESQRVYRVEVAR